MWTGLIFSLVGYFLPNRFHHNVPMLATAVFGQGHYSLYMAYLELNKVLPPAFLSFSASNNDFNMDGVVMLAGALCSNKNLTQIHIRYCLFVIKALNNSEEQHSEHLLFRTALKSCITANFFMYKMQISCKCP